MGEDSNLPVNISVSGSTVSLYELKAMAYAVLEEEGANTIAFSAATVVSLLDIIDYYKTRQELEQKKIKELLADTVVPAIIRARAELAGKMYGKLKKDVDADPTVKKLDACRETVQECLRTQTIRGM